METVLILHHNFPAQFKFIAENLVKKGKRVVFACQTNYGKKIEGVEVVCLGTTEKNEVSAMSEQLANAKQYESYFEKAKKDGIYPNIIISHSGWGCGLYARRNFPNAKIICYAEWWFHELSDEYNFDNSGYLRYNKRQIEKLWLRNLPMTQELVLADEIVTPTKWQKQHIPVKLQETAHVIHEGVDTDYFIYNESWKKEEFTTITYATRGMEPMRGFEEMVKAMEIVLENKKDVRLIIAGEDKVFYGGNRDDGITFGSWAKDYLSKYVADKRVIFTGRLTLRKYARLLKMSDIHLYFTRPFVASWSLLEAMSSGCFVMASDINAVNEILPRQKYTRVDHRNIKETAEKIIRSVGLSHGTRKEIGLNNRNFAIKKYSRLMSLEKWGDLFGN